jgi:hypothetical protein
MGILLGKVLPSGSCLEDPEYSFKDQAVIGSGTASFRSRRRLGNEGLDLVPLLIRQIHDAFTHRTYLRRGKYTKNSRKTNL